MTNAELAILGLVAEQPRHGYEIEQVINERGMRNWTEVGFSSIYYLLKKLEDQGQVESRLEQVGPGPARKVYHTTAAGREALDEAIVEALSQPERCYQLFLLGLSHLPRIPRAQALEAMRRYRAGLEARLAEVHESARRQRPLPDHVEAMFDYSQTLIRAEMAWIDRFITSF
ncbi:MAG: helix-turn-helix transcriptional regulator [Anaerolineae bacterium]